MKFPYFLLFFLLPILGQTAQLYISFGSGSDNRISILDTFTNTIVTNIEVAVPNKIAFLPGSSKAYVGRPNNSVGVLNVDQNFTIGLISMPGAGSISVQALPNGTKVYVNQSGIDAIAVIDTLTDTVIKTVSVGDAPTAIDTTPDGTKVYVANRDSDNVSVIDTATDTVIATISVGNGPAGIAVSPDGSVVYVTNRPGDTISVINTTTNMVTATISVLASPVSVAFTPDGAFAYVTHSDFTSDAITVIDVATNTVSTTITGVGNTIPIAINFDGSRAYAANEFPSPTNLFVIDLATNTVTDTIFLESFTRNLAISPPRSQVNGERSANTSLGQKEFFDTITWTIPTDITTSKYLIYRNDALTDLAAEVNDPSLLKFEEHNLSEDQQSIYKVVAVDEFNNQYLLGGVLLKFK